VGTLRARYGHATGTLRARYGHASTLAVNPARISTTAVSTTVLCRDDADAILVYVIVKPFPVTSRRIIPWAPDAVDPARNIPATYTSDSTVTGIVINIAVDVDESTILVTTTIVRIGALQTIHRLRGSSARRSAVEGCHHD
jgi:hypothetical protein